MAIKPIVFPRFATLDLNNGTGGAPNVVEPSSGKKDTGWNEGERPARETFNWIHRINHDWNAYFDSIADPLQEAWTFAIATAAADPGVNTVRFNNTTLASVTNIYFDDISNSGFDVGVWINRLKNGERLYVQKSNDPSSFVEFRVTGTPVDNTGWWTVPVVVVSSGTIPVAGNALSFIRDPNIDPTVSEIISVTASRTLVLTDKGKTIGFTGAAAAQTMTIPANSSVGYRIGTLIAFDNSGSVSISIAINTDTLTSSSGLGTGTRTLAAGGMAVIQKVSSTSWKIAGDQLT